ncbi:diphosphomevalonate decarboxylase [Flavobacteriaceae bacterium Ap0902]|nr:diphosphomevalonate decarboxylase [Flavobacteriaceae bacterium Ap0902]
MIEKDFITPLSVFDIALQGEVSAQSPSNIALVKYWGKKDPQIPTNPSISYTLTKSFTETTLKFNPKKGEAAHIKVYLDENKEDTFVPKIKKFFDRIAPYAPYLNHYDFELRTHNSFPHSSGIASSASGMSALSKCLIDMEEKLGYTAEMPTQRASFLSRLGSGSACRSVYNGLVNWGKNEYVTDSSDLYATPLKTEINPVFKTFHDTILLIHEGSKTVSSTVGHNLMNNHPYAEARFKEAYNNIAKLINILEFGDLEGFGQLVEHEALSLHAMMMTSNPAFILMKPNTVAALEKVWTFRKETKQPLFFTLDAGANIHLLYPEEAEKIIKPFIANELLVFCQNGKAIYDQVNFD